MAQVSRQLSPHGPLIEVEIGVSHLRARALQASGLRVPKPTKIWALIDTGASVTCIDPTIAKNLQISPSSIGHMHTSSTGKASTEVEQFDISLTISGSQGRGNSLEFLNLRSSACDLAAVNPFHVLIGQDVLAHCVLIQNGVHGSFTLTF